MACFADINISQRFVATYARCGGIFNIHLTANLPRNLRVKNFLKSVEIWQNYGHDSMAPLFCPTLYNPLLVYDDIKLMVCLVSGVSKVHSQNSVTKPSVPHRSWSRFLAVSLQVTWVIKPAVGCHYFSPVGPQLPSQGRSQGWAWGLKPPQT